MREIRWKTRSAEILRMRNRKTHAAVKILFSLFIHINFAGKFDEKGAVQKFCEWGVVSLHRNKRFVLYTILHTICEGKLMNFVAWDLFSLAFFVTLNLLGNFDEGRKIHQSTSRVRVCFLGISDTRPASQSTSPFRNFLADINRPLHENFEARFLG